MSRPLLYLTGGSPPSAAVRMLAEIIGLDLNLKELNFYKMEHKAPEYVKINPMGTVPTLQDGDFIISESHTIMRYLLTKYASKAQQEQLYPSDTRTRALIDQYSYFDTGVFFIRLKVVVLPIFFDGLKEPTPKSLADIDEAFGIVEAYLGDKEYLIGDHVTLADLSLGASALSFRCVHTVNPKKFPRVTKWLSRLEQKPYFKIMLTAADAITSSVQGALANNRKN